MKAICLLDGEKVSEKIIKYKFELTQLNEDAKNHTGGNAYWYIETTSDKEIEQIAFDQLNDLPEGLVFLGCGGSLQEWVDGVTQFLVEQEIIQSSADFDTPVYLETTGGRIDLVFPFAIENQINIGKLAVLRLQMKDCTWTSDYLNNYRGQH